MGLLPPGIEILPPSDDRVLKLILTSPEAKPVLIDLISSIIGCPVVDVMVRNNELPPGDTEEKAERFDVNCSIDDGSQVDLEMQASRIQEDSDGEHRNLKGKSVYAVFFQYANVPTQRETVNNVIESKEVLQMAGSILMSISQDEHEQAVFRSRRMYQTDRESDIATAEDRGIQKGRLAIAQNALQMGMNNGDIVKLTGLTHKEIESLRI